MYGNTDPLPLPLPLLRRTRNRAANAMDSAAAAAAAVRGTGTSVNPYTQWWSLRFDPQVGIRSAVRLFRCFTSRSHGQALEAAQLRKCASGAGVPA